MPKALLGTTRDVAALVDDYARATAAVRFGTCSRTNALPAAEARPILTLPPEQQAEAVVLLMRRVAQVTETDPREAAWNYASAIPPYAGPSALMHALLRRNLPYTAAHVTDMLTILADVRQPAARSYADPAPAVVRAVERHVGAAAPAAPLRRAMTRLEPLLAARGDDGKPKAVLRRLLGLD